MNTVNRIQVAIIDYGMGNLFSVKQCCTNVGFNSIITSDIPIIMKSDAVILPGVGAFGEAMRNLGKKDLISPLKEFIESGKPFMGICLGMQLLMSESEEFGNHKGLNIFKGVVVRFSTIDKDNQKIKVPHVGWNHIFLPSFVENDYWNNSPLKFIKNGEFMYFVHSYYIVPSTAEVVLSVTKYGDMEYCSSILFRNVFACQFHPEKSATEGLKIYKNWLS